MKVFRARRRMARVGATTGIVIGLVLSQAGAALANIDQVNGAAASSSSTAPTPEAGDITIHSTGTVAASQCTTSPAPKTKIRVYQGAFPGQGTTGLPTSGPIFEQVFIGAGPQTAVWPSAGFPRGTYTLTDPLTGSLVFLGSCVGFTDSQTNASNPRRFITIDNKTGMTVSGSGTLGGNTTLTAQLVDLATGRGINGQTIAMTFNGGLPQNITTANVGGVNGIAQIVSPTTLARGDYPLSAAFAETSAWRASAGNAVVHIAGATQTVYTGATSVFWNDTFVPAATVAAIGDPTPVNDTPAQPETVTFTFGSQSENAPVVNGVATGAPFLASANPNTYPITATYTGDPFLVASTGNGNVTIKPRPTATSITGPTSAHFGDNVNLAAKVTDVNTGDPVSGMTVHFSFGSVTADAVTAANGVATKTVTATDDVGSYTLTAKFDGDVHYVTSQASKPFQILFPYEFVDSLKPQGVIRLSPATAQIEVINGTTDSGVRKGTLLTGIYLPTTIAYPTPPSIVLPTLPSNLDILHLPILDKLPLPTLGLPAMSPNLGAPSNAPIFGQTIDQIIVGISSLPQGISFCDVFTESTCALRFVVVQYRDAANKAVVGLFDLKTLMFVAATNFGTPRVMASTGSCLTALPDCLSLTALPAGPPPLPTPPAAPDIAGFVTAVVAQIQAELGSIGLPSAAPAQHSLLRVV